MSTEISMEERVATLEAQVATLMVKVVAKKVASPAKIKVVPVLTGEEPSPADYRLDEVDATLCQGRKLKTEDKRWSPAVYHESQCQGKPSDDGLCTGCASLMEKEAETGKYKRWNGRVGEDLMDHVHMLGSAWAEKCKWTNGLSATASPAAAATAPKEKAAALPTAALPTAALPKVDAAAKAAAKEAEKAAAKEAKAAAKEAEKAAAKAAKAAAKEAEKEAKAAAKKAEKAAAPKKESPKKATKEKVAVATTEAPVSGDHDIMLIDGEMRAVKNGNVYEMDELTQEPGDFIGRLTGTKDAPSIDPDAEEEAESDTD